MVAMGNKYRQKSTLDVFQKKKNKKKKVGWKCYGDKHLGEPP